MASYQELRALYDDSDLMEKMEVAVVVSAVALVGGTPTAAEKSWVAQVLEATHAEAEKALRYVLAANKDLSVAQITGAAETALQAKVDEVVPVLVDALAGV